MEITLSRHANASNKTRRGLTLIEMMITMGVFGFAMMAFMYAYIFGLKQDQLVQSKLGASDQSRRSFEKVARDIRSANAHAVGNYNGTVFTPIINGNDMVGNAIQIYLTNPQTNTPCIVYWFATSGGNGNYVLYRFHTGDSGRSMIANHLQNSATFSAVENYAGVLQQSMFDRDVVHFTLDFKEYQYPLTHVGSGLFYDRYVLDFRATPHVPGGK